jgi:large subunit ribosomal protein L23
MKNLAHILIKPHITEKASMKSESSVYTFVVDPSATKGEVVRAFKEKYKINPIKVNTVTTPAKNVFVRGRSGKKSGHKVAYVYLKKGEKIENL